jgi:hypothetical protein
MVSDGVLRTQHAGPRGHAQMKTGGAHGDNSTGRSGRPAAIPATF